MEKALEHTAKALAGLGPKDAGPSKAFQNLIRQIGEAKTKHEEDRIIRREAQHLKEKVGAPETTPRQMREYLIRLMYCEMLGSECPWGYIHAVKFTQSGNTLDKRVGYLAVSLFLHENHELNMLLVNTLQRDLKSSNMLEVSMALIIICKLIGSEMIPPLLPLVQDKLLHPKEMVRKKAVMAMHHFYTLSPGTVSHLEDDFRRALGDNDPGVMEAALILFHDLTKDDPLKYKDLTQSFTSILSQVIGRKLPIEFDYHSVPSPWVQIRLLRILAILGADDLQTSEKIYGVLEETLASAECTSNIGQAITYECIRTVTAIYPNTSLVEKAAHAIVRFVTASNHNWKYLGINALASLVQVNPKYAAEHQMVVIDCLDDPDETLKRKTLDLLYKMTNPLNVTVITEKMITYLRQTRDEYILSDLVAKITQLAERFAPDNQWFIQTMNAVFELGGNLVRKEVAHNLMRLIAEGTDEEETDTELRLDAVSSYIELLDKPHIPDILVKIICWVVGEYAYVVQDMELEEILENITSLLHRRFEDPDTHGWVITAITKLVSQLGYLPDPVQSQIALYLTSTATDVQQRCSELLELSEDLKLMQEVLPLDSSCEDLEVDSSLSFLDDFVSEALAGGASTYKPPHLRPAPPPLKQATLQPHEIKYQPYALPSSTTHTRLPTTSITPSQDTPPSTEVEPPPSLGTTPPIPSPISEPIPPTRKTSDYSYSPNEVTASVLSVKARIWGRGGYQKTAVPLETSLNIPPSEQPQLEQPGDDGRSLEDEEEEPSLLNTRTAISSVHATIHHLTPEDTKKKELASKLFGNLTGQPRAPRSKRTSGGRTGDKMSPQQVPRKREKPVETDLLLDLADIDFSQPSSAQPPPPTTTLLNEGSSLPLATTGGLLDDLVIHPPEPIAPVSTQRMAPSQLPQPAVSDSADLLGLLEGPVVPSTTSVMAPHLTSDISLLDPTPSSTLPEVREQQGSLALTLFENPIGSIQVPGEYARYPVVSDWNKKEVCHDANLRVSVTKVLKPDQLVLVLFLTNQKQDKLCGVTLTMEPPSNMKALTGDGKEDITLLTDISGFGNVTHVVTVVPSSPSINMSLRGQISYKDNMATQRRVFFDTSIYVSDVIRPLETTTQEFGKKWGSFSYEKKLKLQSSIKKPSEFMELVKKRFNFHPIEIIGNEAIAAGKFLPNTMCLVHGKVMSSQLEFWIRTPSSLLTESIGKLAQLVVK